MDEEQTPAVIPDSEYRIDSLTLSVPGAVAVSDPDEADMKPRTITGKVLPFGVQANHTSMGRPVLFETGSLLVPDDLSRVKLCVDHAATQPVGFMTSLDQRPDAAYATFALPAGAASNLAIDQAKDHLKDGLSVGVDVREGSLTPDGSCYIVRAAVLNEVSLCALPAYTDARVTSIQASRKVKTMDEETPAVTAAPVIAPPFVSAAPAAQSTSLPTIEAAFEAVASALTTSVSAQDVTAAMAKILPAADAGKALIPTQLVGEAYAPLAAARGWIGKASTIRPLESLTVQGWTWDKRATVGDYAGDISEVPSGSASTRILTATAQRLAGGNKVDRVYIDLAGGSLIQSLFDQYARDLALKTDAKARAAIIKAASVLPAMPGASFIDVAIELGLKAMATGSNIDYVALPTDVWKAIAKMTKDQTPWWLGTDGSVNLSAGGANLAFSLFVDPTLPAGTMIAGDRQAHKWFEGPTPKVQAVDVVNGGIDLAVFDYVASLVEAPQAIFSVSVKAA